MCILLARDFSVDEAAFSVLVGTLYTDAITAMRTMAAAASPQIR